MNIYDFMDKNPTFTFFLGFFLLVLITLPMAAIKEALAQKRRSDVILKHGYPPPHCDSDGQFKEETTSDNNENSQQKIH